MRAANESYALKMNIIVIFNGHCYWIIAIAPLRADFLSWLKLLADIITISIWRWNRNCEYHVTDFLWEKHVCDDRKTALKPGLLMRVSSDLENLEMSGNFDVISQSISSVTPPPPPTPKQIFRNGSNPGPLGKFCGQIRLVKSPGVGHILQP